MSLQNYPTAKAELGAAISQEVKDKHNAEVYQSLLNIAWLRDCEANYGILVEWSGTGILTLEACEALVRSNRNSPTLVWTNREELEAEILGMLPNLSQWEVRDLKTRIATWSLLQIRAKVRDLRLRQVIKTKEDARAFLKEARGPEVPKFPGFPQLLPKIFVKEKFQWLPTHEYLYAIAIAAQMGDAHALFDLKRYTRLYGAEQVNFWVARGQEQVQAAQLQQ